MQSSSSFSLPFVGVAFNLQYSSSAQPVVCGTPGRTRGFGRTTTALFPHSIPERKAPQQTHGVWVQHVRGSGCRGHPQPVHGQSLCWQRVGDTGSPASTDGLPVLLLTLKTNWDMFGYQGIELSPQASTESAAGVEKYLLSMCSHPCLLVAAPCSTPWDTGVHPNHLAGLPWIWRFTSCFLLGTSPPS